MTNPLHLPLSGAPAKILTRACHLYALPANRLRAATDWFDIIEHRQFVQLGLIPSEYSGLTAAEHTGIYYRADGQPLNRQRQGSSTWTAGPTVCLSGRGRGRGTADSRPVVAGECALAEPGPDCPALCRDRALAWV